MQTEAKDGYGFGTLFKIPALGGTPQRLIFDVDSPVSLSPDGTQLVFVRNGKGESRLLVAKEDGSEERPIAIRKNPDGSAFLRPAWSPDGKEISVFWFGLKDWRTSLLEVPAQAGQERQLTKHQWITAGISSNWISNGSGLVVNGRRGDIGTPMQFDYVSYPDGEVRRITNDLNY